MGYPITTTAEQVVTNLPLHSGSSEPQPRRFFFKAKIETLTTNVSDEDQETLRQISLFLKKLTSSNLKEIIDDIY